MTGAALLDDLLKIADKNSQDAGYRALGLVWLDYIIKDIQNRQVNYHWRFLEANTFFATAKDDFDYALVTIASDIDTTKIIHVYDKINDRTYRFVPYERFKMFVADEAKQTGDPYIFTIFGSNLILYPTPDFAPVTGSANGTTSNKLVDSTATFITDGVVVGMIATDTGTGDKAIITAVDSEILLSVDTDIFISGDAYSISFDIHLAYVKILIDAADNATKLLIPDKYKTVIMDGLLVWAFKFDSDLGNPISQQQIHELGIDRMIRDNSQIIAENERPLSHRVKHHLGHDIDRKNSNVFPLSGANF